MYRMSIFDWINLHDIVCTTGTSTDPQFLVFRMRLHTYLYRQFVTLRILYVDLLS